MPELPEVETMVRGIRPFVEGRVVQDLIFHPIECRPMSVLPPLNRWKSRLIGNAIENVSRLGKRVVLRVSDGSHLVIEPRMTGLVLLDDAPDREHLRFTIQLQPNSRFRHNSVSFWDRRGLGVLRWFSPEKFEQAFSKGRLGPDALEITLNEWKRAFEDTRRSVKVVLLDQSVVAGIGNLYASEILFVAGVLPDRPANTLSIREISRIAKATQDVLKTAVECEGSTLGDATYRNALNQIGSYQNQHRVYQKTGEPCPRCRVGAIERCVLAQRATFYCPKCQK